MSDFKQQQIEDYLKGKLSTSERASFEEMLKKDTVLAEELAATRESLELIEKMRDMELKQQVQAVQQTYEASRQTKPKRRVLWQWAAAVAAGLLLLVLAYQWMQPPLHEQLYSTNYSAYELSFGSRDGEGDAQLANANVHYQQGAYAEALPLLEATLKQEEDATVRLATAICLLETRQYDRARKTLAPLIEQKDPTFEFHASWYSALAWLWEGQLTEALTLLQSNASHPGAFQADKAKALINELTK